MLLSDSTKEKGRPGDIPDRPMLTRFNSNF